MKPRQGINSDNFVHPVGILVTDLNSYFEGLDKRKSFICNSSVLLVNQVTDQNYEIFV